MPAEPTEPAPTLAQLRRAVVAAQSTATAATEASHADEAREQRAQRRLDALGPQPTFFAWLDDNPDPDDPDEWLSFDEQDALYLTAVAPWTRAEEAVRAAADEWTAGRRRVLAAEQAVAAAERKERFAAAMEEAAAADEEWEELVAENERLRRTLREARGQAVEVRDVATQASGTWPTCRVCARACEAWEAEPAAEPAAEAGEAAGEATAACSAQDSAQEMMLTHGAPPSDE